jgi:hypothetical protein
MTRSHHRCLTLIGALAIASWTESARADGSDAADKPGPERSTTANADHPPPPEDEAFRIGALGAAGFPHPLAIEGLVKLGGVVALGLEYGVMPTFDVSGVDASLWSLAGDLRVFPFGGAFFFGLRGGHQHLGASTTLTVSGIGSLTESAALDTWFLNPRLGLLWRTESGLAIGCNVGLQVPMASSFSSTVAVPTGSAIASTVNDIVRVVGGPLPTIDLVQFGLLL